MNPKEFPIRREFSELEVGQSVSFDVKFSQEDMNDFGRLSGDVSRIHRDADFARKNQFEGPVVYGGLVVAKLSYLVGMHLPGDLGLATDWKIDFRNPIYVGDIAQFSGNIIFLSKALRHVRLEFFVCVGDAVVASGEAGSTLLTG